MRHRKHGYKLGRSTSHRKALRRNLVRALFLEHRIETTPQKAKAARPLAEHLIQIAKRGLANPPGVHERRLAKRLLPDDAVVRALFTTVAPAVADHPGGTTRILHLEGRRLGDNAQRCLWEIIGLGTTTARKRAEDREQRLREAERKAKEREAKRQAMAGGGGGGA